MKKLLIKTETFLNNSKIQEFLYDNRYIILIPFLIAVIVNSIDIFTIKFGIDAEMFARLKEQVYTKESRYGSLLLYYILPLARFHMVSQLIGLLSLILAALLTISKHKIPNNTKFVFVLLFILYPSWNALQYHYFQYAYNCICLLLVVMAYRLIEKNNFLYYIIASLFLFIGISSYQSNLAIFLTVMMINAILNYIENKDIKKEIVKVIKNMCILIITLSIYYLCFKIFSNGLGGWHSSLIKYDNFPGSLIIIFKEIIKVFFSMNSFSDDNGNIIVTILFLILLPYLIYKKFNQKAEIINMIILFIFFILAIFSVNIVLQNMLFNRANISYAYYSSFIILLILLYAKKTTTKYLIYFFVIIICIYQSSNKIKYQMTSYLVYQEDKRNSEYLLTEIKKKVPDIYSKKYKIVYYGNIIYKNLFFSNLVKYKVEFGNSMFSVNGGRSDRFYNFMRLHGLSSTVELKYITPDIENYINTLPTFPNPDCIGLYDNDTIVVKLANKKGGHN